MNPGTPAEYEPELLSSGVRDVRCGRGVKIVQPSNLYGCELGDDVFVGPFVEIQRGVRIGDRTRIQSHAFVCEEVIIGRDCFVSHGVKFINDPFTGGQRAMGDRGKYRQTVVADGVLIGTNATILPVRIGPGVTVGAGAVVTRDLIEPGTYAGNPAQLLHPS